MLQHPYKSSSFHTHLCLQLICGFLGLCSKNFQTLPHTAIWCCQHANCFALNSFKQLHLPSTASNYHVHLLTQRIPHVLETFQTTPFRGLYHVCLIRGGAGRWHWWWIRAPLSSLDGPCWLCITDAAGGAAISSARRSTLCLMDPSSTDCFAQPNSPWATDRRGCGENKTTFKKYTVSNVKNIWNM